MEVYMSLNSIVPQAKDLWKEGDDKRDHNGAILISAKSELKKSSEKTPICTKHKAIGMCE